MATLLVVVGTAPVATKTVSVQSIAMSWVKSSNTTGYISGIVTIVDQAGKPIANADVSVAATGLVSGNILARTNSKGQVTVNTSKISSSLKGTETYTVTNVALTGYVYDATKNKVTSASLTR